MKVLFVGEKRSPTAIRRGFRWEHGRLAAKQLFDALDALSFPRESCVFANAYERGHITKIASHRGPIVAMGLKAQEKLAGLGIGFVPMIHPAARGKIRGKAAYKAHTRSVLAEALGTFVVMYQDPRDLTMKGNPP